MRLVGMWSEEEERSKGIWSRAEMLRDKAMHPSNQNEDFRNRLARQIKMDKNMLFNMPSSVLLSFHPFPTHLVAVLLL